jgi:hypothetical protein
MVDGNFTLVAVNIERTNERTNERTEEREEEKEENEESLSSSLYLSVCLSRFSLRENQGGRRTSLVAKSKSIDL